MSSRFQRSHDLSCDNDESFDLMSGPIANWRKHGRGDVNVSTLQVHQEECIPPTLLGEHLLVDEAAGSRSFGLDADEAGLAQNKECESMTLGMRLIYSVVGLFRKVSRMRLCIMGYSIRVRKTRNSSAGQPRHCSECSISSWYRGTSGE